MAPNRRELAITFHHQLVCLTCPQATANLPELPNSLRFPKQVDCRRTDRDQPMFAVPSSLRGEEEKEGGGAGDGQVTEAREAEEGSQTALNRGSASSFG